MLVTLLCQGVVELPVIITARLGDLLFCDTLKLENLFVEF